MLGLQALCIASSASPSLCPSPTNRNDHYFGYAFAEVERQADEPSYVFSCRKVAMPATSTSVEDPLGGFSGGFVKEYGMRDVIRRHYKGLREELDMTRNRERHCGFIAPE